MANNFYDVVRSNTATCCSLQKDYELWLKPIVPKLNHSFYRTEFQQETYCNQSQTQRIRTAEHTTWEQYIKWEGEKEERIQTEIVIIFIFWVLFFLFTCLSCAKILISDTEQESRSQMHYITALIIWCLNFKMSVYNIIFILFWWEK